MTDGLIKKRKRYRKVTEYKGIFLERNDKVPSQLRHIHVHWGSNPPTEGDISEKLAQLDKEAKGRHADNVVTTLFGSVGETFMRKMQLGTKAESNAVDLG